MARLQTPPAERPTPNFNTGAMSAGSAIEQAARAAMSNRGGYGGDNGDYGLGQGKQGGEAIGPMDVLSDTMGVDFGPYLARVLHDVRENWYRIIPESARAPLMKKGKVSIEFAILKNGQVAGLQIVGYVRRCGARSRRLRRDHRVQTLPTASHRIRRPISGAALPLLLQPG